MFAEQKFAEKFFHEKVSPKIFSAKNSSPTNFGRKSFHRKFVRRQILGRGSRTGVACAGGVTLHYNGAWQFCGDTLWMRPHNDMAAVKNPSKGRLLNNSAAKSKELLANLV